MPASRLASRRDDAAAELHRRIVPDLEPRPLPTMKPPATLLVVDDEPSIREAVALWLQHSGYEVAVAATGQEGLEMVRHLRPSLVLLDVELQDVRGTEVCRQIKADPALADVFVVLISGMAISPEQKVTGLEEGADEYLTKPIGTRELLARVRTCLCLRDTAAALRAKQAQLRVALEAAGMVAWEWDIPTAVIRYEDTLSAVVRGNDSTPRVSLDLVRQRIHPEDRELFDEAVNRTVAGDGDFECENRCLMLDGTYRWIRTRGRAVATRGGRPDRVVGVSQDIHDRKEVELRLLHIEKALAASGAAVGMSTAQGVHFYQNEAFTRLFGYTAQELGQTNGPMHVFADPAVGRSVFRTIETGVPWIGEMDLVAKDGRRFPAEMRADAVTDDRGRITGLIGVMADISERKQAEERFESLRKLGFAIAGENDLPAALRLCLETAIRVGGMDAGGIYMAGESSEDYRLACHSGLSAEFVASVSHLPADSSNVRWARQGRLLHSNINALELSALAKERQEGLKALSSLPILHEGRLVAILNTASHSASEVPPACRVAMETVASLLGGVIHRLRVEVALQESERLQRLALKVGHIGTVEVNLTTKRSRWSPEWAAIWGMPENFTGDLQAFCLAHVYPDDHRRVQALLAEEIQIGVELAIVFRIIRPDGVMRWISSRGMLVQGTDGESGLIVGVIQDVTEDREADRQRSTLSWLGYRLSAQNTPAEAAESILGAAADIIGGQAGQIHRYDASRNVVTLVASLGEANGRRLQLPPARRTGKPTALMRMAMAGGAKLVKPRAGSCSLMCVPIYSRSECLGFLSLLGNQSRTYAKRDLELLETLANHCGEAFRRTLVTEALQEAEAKYRHLFENATEGIFQIAPDGLRLISANPALARMMGYETPEEFIAAVPDLGKLHVRPELRAEFRQRMEAGGCVSNFEMEVRRRDGSTIYVAVNERVVRDADGAILHFQGTAQDITAHRQAAAALAVNQRFQAAIFNNIPDAAWLKNRHGEFLICNEPLARAYGLSTRDIIGKTIFEVSPEEALQFTQEDQFVMSSGKSAVFEVCLRNAQGQRLWFETRKSPVFNEHGEVTGTVGIARNITQRIWATEQLQQERDLSLALGASSNLADAAQRLVEHIQRNEGVDYAVVYMAETGSSHPRLIAQNSRPATCTKFVAGLASAASKRPGTTLGHFVARLCKKESPTFKAIPVWAGESIAAVLCICNQSGHQIPAASLQTIDILATQAGIALDRLLAEQNLQAARQLNEKMLASLRSAVFVLDAAADKILECNHAATQVLGYLREELVGQSVAQLHPEPDKHARFKKEKRMPHHAPAESIEFESIARRKDGSLFPAEHKLTSIRDDEGRVTNWVCVIRDITVYKRAQAELRAISQRIITAQEGERRRVARELHDGVNQILAALRLRLRRLEEGESGLSIVTRETLARSSELLTSALEENRRIAHNLRPGDLDALGFEAACRSFCNQFGARTNLAVRLHLARLKHRLPGDVELNFFRIIQEALSNVEKHSSAKTVKVDMRLHRGSARLVIRDDGHGFDPHSTRPAQGKRLGIGLASIRERAASLGGTCEIESAKDSGTVITVHAPVNPDFS